MGMGVIGWKCTSRYPIQRDKHTHVQQPIIHGVSRDINVVVVDVVVGMTPLLLGVDTECDWTLHYQSTINKLD
jgi:hypothetical protein